MKKYQKQENMGESIKLLLTHYQSPRIKRFIIEMAASSAIGVLSICVSIPQNEIYSVMDRIAQISWFLANSGINTWACVDTVRSLKIGAVPDELKQYEEKSSLAVKLRPYAVMIVGTLCTALPLTIAVWISTQGSVATRLYNASLEFVSDIGLEAYAFLTFDSKMSQYLIEKFGSPFRWLHHVFSRSAHQASLRRAMISFLKDAFVSNLSILRNALIQHGKVPKDVQNVWNHSGVEILEHLARNFPSMPLSKQSPQSTWQRGVSFFKQGARVLTGVLGVTMGVNSIGDYCSDESKIRVLMGEPNESFMSWWPALLGRLPLIYVYGMSGWDVLVDTFDFFDSLLKGKVKKTVAWQLSAKVTVFLTLSAMLVSSFSGLPVAQSFETACSWDSRHEERISSLIIGSTFIINSIMLTKAFLLGMLGYYRYFGNKEQRIFVRLLEGLDQLANYIQEMNDDVFLNNIRVLPPDLIQQMLGLSYEQIQEKLSRIYQLENEDTPLHASFSL